MKCPKCGYNSFEFLDTCKKCGAEFVSFKKDHRISPVILTPGAASEVKAAPEEPVISAAAVPPVVQDSPLERDSDEFSWDTSGEPATTGREESPYSGFDLGFHDSVDTGTQDNVFTGFSFSEEPAVQHPDEPSAPDGEGLDAFSFQETLEEVTEASPLEMKSEEPDSGTDGYERLLELGSTGGADAPAGGLEDTGSAKTGDFEADDFSFTPEPVVEDIFQLEEDTVTAAPSEKKPQPNLSDFDKEFEQIFSFGESSDSGEENTKR
jgi:hypothetical protein